MKLEVIFFLVISILDIIFLIYMLLDVIFKWQLSKKIGRKLILKVMAIMIAFSIIVGFLAIPNIENFYNLNRIVKHSSLEKYIKSYNLSGYKNCVLTIEGTEEFEKLDDKAKLAYMEELNHDFTISIFKTFWDGNRDEYDIFRMYHENKVIVNVEYDTYITYSTSTEENKLFLNGKVIYEREEVKYLE